LVSKLTPAESLDRGFWTYHSQRKRIIWNFGLFIYLMLIGAR